MDKPELRAHEINPVSFRPSKKRRVNIALQQALMCLERNHTCCYPLSNAEKAPEKPMTDKPATHVAQEPVSLPNDAQGRLEYPMADGLLDYFPNALAEVARLSYLATQQHHPDQPMHWDRSKSTDHRNKIMRHLVDTHTVDDKGIDHWAMVCWRALAGYQEYLEAKHGLPASRASRNAPQDRATAN